MRLATRAWGDEGSPLAILIHGVMASSRTWWRVGPWFAEGGWRAVAVDLRGHGASPRMRGGETLADLAEDVHETVPAEPVDVLLGHSLGALTALQLCALRGNPARRVVLEDPPGPQSSDSREVARGVEAIATWAREDPDALTREMLSENRSLTASDAANSVLGMRDCDAGPVADLVEGLDYDLLALARTVEVPALLVLADEGGDSALLGSERAAVASALRRGVREEVAVGHNVHRDDFEGYVRLLGSWLGGPGA